MRKSRLRLPVMGFVITGVVGYLLLVFAPETLPQPDGEDPWAVVSVLARLAPVWLVFWLAAAAGGLGYNWRSARRARGAGRVAGGAGSAPPACERCGTYRVIRRGPGGAPRWACPRGCDDGTGQQKDDE